jgi:hypothetical protein
VSKKPGALGQGGGGAAQVVLPLEALGPRIRHQAHLQGELPEAQVLLREREGVLGPDDEGVAGHPEEAVGAGGAHRLQVDQEAAHPPP